MREIVERKKEVAVFGGGCFWCTEAVFKMLRGVESVVPGYAGGNKVNPTYEEVSGGSTGHAEVIRIEYDPTQITFRDLMTVFFTSHDPTTLNKQGNDVGTQYRSVIFYTNLEQQEEAEMFIAELNIASPEGGKIVTQVVPLGEFYFAEDYHKDYFAKNPQAQYCQLVVNPKLEKIQKEFVALLKNNSVKK